MATIVHFDVPSNDSERAKKFYAALFGWKFQAVPEMEYNLITTTNLDGDTGCRRRPREADGPVPADDQLFRGRVDRCRDEAVTALGERSSRRK